MMAAWPLTVLAATGTALAATPVTPGCSAPTPDALAALTRSVPQQPAGGSKFALAEAACGAAAGAPAAVPLTPRRAAQLALYDRPAADAGELDLSPALPAATPTPPRQATAPRRASGASAAAVQRIRALVPVVAEAARRHGIDPLLLHAVAHVESRHQAAAQSHAGARGVMQVMPATARRFGLGDPQRELLQPALNVDVGAEYLKTLQVRFGNNLTLVLAAYNAGEGAVEKYGRRIPPYPETQAYVRDVLAIYGELRRRLGVGSAGAVGSV